MHLQSEWQRTRDANSAWTGFASFTVRRQTSDLAPVDAVVTERLTDGPVPDIVSPLGTDRAWSIGGRLTPLNWSRRHTPQGGVTLTGGNSNAPAPFNVRIGELVNGIPARIWDYSTSGRDFQAHQVTLAAYAGDTMTINPRLIVDGGLRRDGQARLHPQSVSCTTGIRAPGCGGVHHRQASTLVRLSATDTACCWATSYGDSSAPIGNAPPVEGHSGSCKCISSPASDRGPAEAGVQHDDAVSALRQRARCSPKDGRIIGPVYAGRRASRRQADRLSIRARRLTRTSR